MRRLPILVFCVALLAMSCAGDSADDVAVDEPPWGLASIDMPDTAEEVSAMMAAFPDEIEGMSLSGENPYGVQYDDPYSPGMPWVVHAQSDEQRAMMGLPGIITAEDWLRYIGSDQMLGASEWERALTGDLLWVANNAPMEIGPGQMGTVYMLNWAETDGGWAFYIQATSATARLALVEAFITAAGG